MKFIGLLIAALVLAIAGPVTANPTFTNMGAAACNTAAASCSVNVAGSIPAGSFVLFVADVGIGTGISTLTVSDNAQTANCSGAYTKVSTSNTAAATTLVVAYCPVTSRAMTSGTTCGAGGTTQCAFTVAITGTTTKFRIHAFLVTGLSTSTPYDKTGTAVNATWTSGTALSTVPTSPSLGYSSEYALSLVGVTAGAAADSIGSITGGYSVISSDVATGTNDPALFIYGQSITTGTVTLGGMPSSSAGRAYLANTYLFVASSASFNFIPTLLLMGVGQ